MSLTAMVWVMAYMALLILMFRRPGWGIALYLLTIYLAPHAWWWGGPLLALSGRINLITALTMAAVVFINKRDDVKAPDVEKNLIRILVIYAINAFFIHFLMASNVPRSLDGMTMIWKQLGLIILFIFAIRSRYDFEIFVGAVLVGSTYIGYEVVVNEVGGTQAGRLEGVGRGHFGDANYLSGMLAFVLPFAAYWLYFGQKWQKAVAIAALVLVFEVILRCNSRGCFLALLVSGGVLLMNSRGKARKYAIYSCILAVIACYMMIGNNRIVERFKTTFVSEEERDNSAAGRIEFWKAAARMIGDYPMGSGAEAAFKSDRGLRYSRHLKDEYRGVHNGYLDITASWGLQGIVIYLSAVFYVWTRVYRTRRAAFLRGDPKAAFLGNCIEASLVITLVVSMFLSSLDDEWVFWWLGLSVGYCKIFGAEGERHDRELAEKAAAEDESEWDDDGSADSQWRHS